MFYIEIGSIPPKKIWLIQSRFGGIKCFFIICQAQAGLTLLLNNRNTCRHICSPGGTFWIIACGGVNSNCGA